MRPITLKGPAPALLAAMFVFLLAACGGDGGLSQSQVESVVSTKIAAMKQTDKEKDTDQDVLSASQVEEMIQTQMEDQDTPQAGVTQAQVQAAIKAEMQSAPDSGVSKSQVEEMISSAMTAVPGNGGGVTPGQAASIARNVIASIPPKSDPEAYTKYVVENAMSRYQTNGLEVTVDYYNQPKNVDGQWYVFIIDEDDTVISHYDPDRLGLDLNGWVGTDANGYNFGPGMLSADEDGKWVSYVYKNPETGYTPDVWGQENLKNAWVVRHEGMLFGSGWYVDSEEFTKASVREAASVFRQSGLEGTITHFLSGKSSVAGMTDTLAYYNAAPNVDGKFHAFIADREGNLITHTDPTLIGQPLTAIFGADAPDATRQGNWVSDNYQDGSLAYRAWIIDDAGLTFGSGWFGDEPLN
jgi:hypothetical protein